MSPTCPSLYRFTRWVECPFCDGEYACAASDPDIDKAEVLGVLHTEPFCRVYEREEPDEFMAKARKQRSVVDEMRRLKRETEAN